MNQSINMSTDRRKHATLHDAKRTGSKGQNKF